MIEQIEFIEFIEFINGGAAGGGANQAPTDIAWAGVHTVAEDATIGTQVGGALSFVDPDPGETGTFSIVGPAAAYFSVSGTTVVVAGALDFETASSHNVTIRFTDSVGNTYNEVFVVTVTDVSESAGEMFGFPFPVTKAA